MSRLGSLQVLRAIAALAIALIHFQTDAERIAAEAGQRFTLVLVEHLGAGVDLFFVISGFVMVYASKGLFERPGAALEFLGRRIARIVPLYWAMTGVVLAVMLANPALLSSGGVSAVEIVKSFLFVPYQANGTGLMQPVYKLGWTLNYEMTFYLVFALFLVLPMRRALAGVAITLGALILAGQVIAPAPGAFAFWSSPIMLEFVFGMGIALAYIEGVRIPMPASVLLVVLGVVGLALVPATGIHPEGKLRFVVWGLPAAAILAGSLLARRAPVAPVAPSGFVLFLEKMGDASYAIYLVHPLVIRGLRVIWAKAGLAGVLSPWVYVVAGIVILVPISILIYERFEKPLTKAAQGALAARRASAPEPRAA